MFDLGKFLKASFAQVNPFDNGADWNSVYNQPKRSPQTSGSSPLNVRQAQSQAPTVTGAPPTRQEPNWFQKNVIDPTVEAGNKTLNTAMIPIRGIASMPAIASDQLFNGGKNTSSLVNSANRDMDAMIKKSWVSPEVASGKATPLQFGAEFTRTGAELAPYFVAGGTGKLAAPLGNKVTSAVIGKGGTNLAGALAGKAMVAATDASIAIPTFAAIDALRQGATAIQNGGQTGFDPTQAIQTGVLSGVMAGGGRVVGDTANFGMKKVGAAVKHPEVAKFEPEYEQLTAQLKATTDPITRREVAQAIVENRRQRLATQRQIEGFNAGKPPQDVAQARSQNVAPIKVLAKGGGKQVPVRQLTREGDIVTATNVNKNLKGVYEKRFSVGDDGELMPDRKGATSVFTDSDGRVQNIRIGNKVYGKKDFGDLSDVNDYGSSLATMRRNVERGFGKETSEKLNNFLVDHQQGQATKMVERKVALNTSLKQVANELGINFQTRTGKAKKVSAAIQDYGEGAKTKAELVKEFGQEQAQKIVAADKWFRKQYDTLLDEANTTLKQFGYDPIPKRKNYYTHFQDESVWKKFGLKMDEIRNMLGDPTMQDAIPDGVRGKISNKLAGQSEFTQPGKKFNRFALQRKGEAHTSDAFQAFERYMEPTLNNIYMTPSISRARVISRAIAQDADIAGKDANKILIQMKEWANDLAGKSNRFDRPIVDSKWGNRAIQASQWLQKKAGQNTIVGNLSTAVMQPIVLAQTAGKFGYKNTMLGLMRQAGKETPEMAQSGFLKRRYSDLHKVTESKMDKARSIANTPLEVVEETATRATWDAAYLTAKDKGLTGKNAIKWADAETEKTVAGRSIGEKPEMFRSKAAGAFSMYQLEVSNYWQQFGKEMTKTQAAKTLVAAYGINSLLEISTGRRVGFDPISAAIDMYDETQKQEKSNTDKLISIGQRGLGETVDNLPFAGQLATSVIGDKNYKEILGPDSQGGRFGVSSPVSTLASNPEYLVLPFGGSQMKKTFEGVNTISQGKMTDKNGETTVDVPKTAPNAVRATLFGPSAIPEVNQYYNNLGKKKVDQKQVQNQIVSEAGTMSLQGLKKKQQEELQTLPEYARSANRQAMLAKNAEERKKKQADTGKSPTSKTEIGSSTSADSTSLLKKYEKVKDRETWFEKEYGAEYKYLKAKYENDKSLGTISDVEDIKRKRELAKAEVGSKYSKKARDLYSLNKSQIASYLATSKDKERLTIELLSYDKELKNGELISYLKFKTGIQASAKKKGRVASKGRKSGKGSRFKVPSTNVANKASIDTLGELSRLLTGTKPKNTTPKQIAKKATVKKIIA